MQQGNQKLPIETKSFYPILLCPGECNPGQIPWLNAQLNELVFLQFEINQQLFVNQMLTDNYVNQLDNRADKSLSSEGSTTQGISYHGLLESRVMVQNDTKKKLNKPSKKAIKKSKRKQESDYQPCSDSLEKETYAEYKLSQSKNAPKNFANSILNFISKNKLYVEKVLAYTQNNYDSFCQFISKYKSKISTISELKFLWIESLRNPYARSIRIISEQYLKKYSLSHIFNSRVANHGRHVKYRQKILKEIQKPQEFTQMKDY